MPTDPSRLSILLPTYNEKDNILELITRIKQALPREKEILVIDDNSPDGTAAAVRARYGKDPGVRVIVRRNERGLASAVARGIREAGGGIIVWMDTDLSMAPESVPALLEPVDSGEADAAVGSRYVPGGADIRIRSGQPMLYLHTLLSVLITRFTSLLLWPAFKDWTSGFIAVRAEAVKPLAIRGDYGEYFIDLMYRLHKRGCRIKEVPYTLSARERGQSKTAPNVLGFITRGVKYIATVFALRFGLHRSK